MNACCFSQHPGLPFSCVGSRQHNPVTPLPTADLPCHLPLCQQPSSVSQAPCAFSPGLQSWWATFHSSAQAPRISLPGTFHSSSFQPPFPTPTPRPGFLQRGPSIFCTPSPQPQSFSLGCFSPPIYTTSTNKTRAPTSSPFGVQEVNDTECRSPWLCQKAPRRALPETSCSVPAAIDHSTVSADRNIKEFSSQTYKPPLGVCKLQFSKGL